LTVCGLVLGPPRSAPNPRHESFRDISGLGHLVSPNARSKGSDDRLVTDHSSPLQLRLQASDGGACILHVFQ